LEEKADMQRVHKPKVQVIFFRFMLEEKVSLALLVVLMVAELRVLMPQLVVPVAELLISE
jgi:hypothetical protein